MGIISANFGKRWVIFPLLGKYLFGGATSHQNVFQQVGTCQMSKICDNWAYFNFKFSIKPITPARPTLKDFF